MCRPTRQFWVRGSRNVFSTLLTCTPVAKPSPFLPVVCRNCCEHIACNSSTQFVFIVLPTALVCGIGDKPLGKLKWLFRIALLPRRAYSVSITGGYVRCCAASFVFGGVYHRISHQMPVRPFLSPGKVAPALLLGSSVVLVSSLETKLKSPETPVYAADAAAAAAAAVAAISGTCSARQGAL